VAALLAVMCARLGAAAGLRPETVAGWERYVRATEARTAADGGIGQPLAATGVEVTGAISRAPDGQPIEVPGALVHHWRGRVFIPRASVGDILARVAHPGAEDRNQEDVVAARVLARGPGSLRLFLRLRRTAIVTVVYNTEHDVHYGRQPDGDGWSRSRATRIAEVAEPDTTREHERLPGDDRGFLLRLNSYWRYEAVPGGTLVECESISLSRGAPAVVLGAVRPVIDQVARGSMERTLLAMRARFTQDVEGARR
jgi:hypothetical protein